jgi:hypothetical protein
MAVSWMKKGAESAAAIKQADVESEIKKEQNQRMWRFYLKEGKEARITFVDGDLTPEGLLDIVTFKEHQIFMNGSWQNWFPCTNAEEPCPICESGDEPSLVGALTVIDHSESTSKDGTKKYKDQKRLFVAKRETLKLLQTLGAKRGGLAGCTFDAMRIGERAANVGSTFDFIEKQSLADLNAKYPTKDAKGNPIELFTPADYEKEIQYRTAKELRALGFGSANPIGAEVPMTDNQDYDKHL